jgi:hypothetical protein
MFLPEYPVDKEGNEHPKDKLNRAQHMKDGETFYKIIGAVIIVLVLLCLYMHA